MYWNYAPRKKTDFPQTISQWSGCQVHPECDHHTPEITGDTNCTLLGAWMDGQNDRQVDGCYTENPGYSKPPLNILKPFSTWVVLIQMYLILHRSHSEFFLYRYSLKVWRKQVQLVKTTRVKNDFSIFKGGFKYLDSVCNTFWAQNILDTYSYLIPTQECSILCSNLVQKVLTTWTTKTSTADSVCNNCHAVSCT